MKFETFRLTDLFIKGEGNLHVVVLNNRSGQVFRFPKEDRKETQQFSDTCQLDNFEATKLYKIAINYKKYNVLQKFWGKDYLPKTAEMRVCLFPKQLIELIAVYLEPYRLDLRKNRSIITKTSYIEIQPDLTRLPYEYNFFTDGATFCIELKPKFGILFQPRSNLAPDCRNIMSRFCIAQLKKKGAAKTDYCPCDMFSGNPQRMDRALRALIKNPQDKLRIFINGQIANVSEQGVINSFVHNFFPGLHINDEGAIERFCDLIIQALLNDVTETLNLLRLPYKIFTNCQAHSWSDPNLSEIVTDSKPIYTGSILGRFISTSCLLDSKTEEMNEIYKKLKIFLDENHIEKTENIFDLWNEHLLPLDLPEDITDIVRTLKKYLVCLTIRDCSIMIKFKRAQVDNLSVKQSNTAVIKQPDGSVILTMLDVIDISIKPISKIKINFEYEQELKRFMNLTDIF